MSDLNTYNKRFQILSDLVARADEAERDGGYDLDEWLDRLDALDKEQSPNEWYEFVNLIDALWRNVKLCEGRHDSIVTGLDTITAEILRFKARVSEEGKE